MMGETSRKDLSMNRSLVKFFSAAIAIAMVASACTKKPADVSQNQAAAPETAAQVAAPAAEPKLEMVDSVVGKGAEAMEPSSIPHWIAKPPSPSALEKAK